MLKKQDDGAVIDEIFWATVVRPPRAEELKTIRESLASGDPREEVYRDLFWALLNSKDFAFNH